MHSKSTCPLYPLMTTSIPPNRIASAPPAGYTAYQYFNRSFYTVDMSSGRSGRVSSELIRQTFTEVRLWSFPFVFVDLHAKRGQPALRRCSENNSMWFTVRSLHRGDNHSMIERPFSIRQHSKLIDTNLPQAHFATALESPRLSPPTVFLQSPLPRTCLSAVYVSLPPRPPSSSLVLVLLLSYPPRPSHYRLATSFIVIESISPTVRTWSVDFTHQ